MPKTKWSPTDKERLREMEWSESLPDVRRKLRSYVLVILFGALFWVGVIFAYLYLAGK